MSAWKKRLLLVAVIVLATASIPALCFAAPEGGDDGLGGDLAAAISPMTAQAGNIASGTSGTCVWTIDSGGALIVRPLSGNAGVIEVRGDTDGAPWSAYEDKITSAKFEGTVKTRTCSWMFANCTAMQLTLPRVITPTALSLAA